MANCNVTHIIWGHGKIVFRDERYVRVLFDDASVGEKTFVYPDAFSKYIKYTDPQCQSQIENEIKAAAEEEAKNQERLRRERAAAAAAALEKEKMILSKRKKAIAYSRKRAEKLRVKPVINDGIDTVEDEPDIFVQSDEVDPISDI